MNLEKPYAYASFLIRIKPSKDIIPEYLLWYMNSSEARSQMFVKAKSSYGIHNINSKELGAISVNVPNLKAQIEIVGKNQIAYFDDLKSMWEIN